MNILLVINLLLVVFTATAVVVIRNTTYQAIILSLYGFILATLFLIFHSPDVAMAQGVVNGIIIPLVILFSLAKVRDREEIK